MILFPLPLSLPVVVSSLFLFSLVNLWLVPGNLACLRECGGLAGPASFNSGGRFLWQDSLFCYIQYMVGSGLHFVRRLRFVQISMDNPSCRVLAHSSHMLFLSRIRVLCSRIFVTCSTASFFTAVHIVRTGRPRTATSNPCQWSCWCPLVRWIRWLGSL